jgi:uncharacterized protein (DUF39 family)/CBS domain-containing protein
VKTVDEINRKIKEGNANVVTALEMKSIVSELGGDKAAEEVDLVTTGTFGAMCSSGAFLNFGHSDPPIKMKRVWLNGVEAYTGIAAVDAYLGATQLSKSKDRYGGGHVLEELVRGREVELKAEGYVTDCYPRKEVTAEIGLGDLNQAVMVNPRNSYQRYRAAANSSDRTLHTYMGTLLPNLGNVAYAGVGSLSPLNNDPEYRTIGVGTRIFLGGAKGYVIGEGTQHSPPFGTMMVKGDMREMSPKWLKGAYFQGYGPTLFVGIGAAIPILDSKMAESTGITDEKIMTEIVDYGVQRRERPVIRSVNYAELASGMVEIGGEEVRVSPLSSYYHAKKIAEELADMIKKEKFFLTVPVGKLEPEGTTRPLRHGIKMVKGVMRGAITVLADTSAKAAARLMVESGATHLPVVTGNGVLLGIVTSWDIAKVVAEGKEGNVSSIMTRKVITASSDEDLSIVAGKMERYRISALPVVDVDGKVIGLITSEDVGKALTEARR